MPTKNPDLNINSLIIINTAQSLAVNSALENGVTQQIINENNLEKITENSNSINTLNNLIEANVNTNGNYFSAAGSINDLSGEIRPILNTNDPLDSNYVIVDIAPNPNLFTNLVNGRVIFNLSIANLINDEVAKILSIKIYFFDGTLIKQIDKNVEANFNGAINLINGIDINEGSQVYFTFSITSGTGVLTSNNEIQYAIEFSTKGTSGAKASQVIDDSSSVLNSGINPKLNQIIKKVNIFGISTTENLIGHIENEGFGNVIISLENEDPNVLKETRLIVGDKKIKANIQDLPTITTEPFLAIEEDDLTTKKYVDSILNENDLIGKTSLEIFNSFPEWFFLENGNRMCLKKTAPFLIFTCSTPVSNETFGFGLEMIAKNTDDDARDGHIVVLAIKNHLI